VSRKSSIREKPIGQRPRRLAEWLNPTGAKKVHSLVDKVYKKKNLEMAWQKVRQNKGAGGVDGESIESFDGNREANLDRLHQELKSGTYRPEPVRRQMIPKPGQPGKMRPLGIPTIYDRVCQQALFNRLEPIFDPVFDEANFGYRKGRSPKDALRKVWGGEFGWVAPLLGRGGVVRSPQGNREGFIECLKHLYRRLRGYTIHLYVDGAQWHKGEEVDLFVRTHRRLHLEYLPPYQPGLNVQERI